jgi:hypothetical protein
LGKSFQGTQVGCYAVSQIQQFDIDAHAANFDHILKKIKENKETLKLKTCEKSHFYVKYQTSVMIVLIKLPSQR